VAVAGNGIAFVASAHSPVHERQRVPQTIGRIELNPNKIMNNQTCIDRMSEFLLKKRMKCGALSVSPYKDRYPMDDTDLHILASLQANARTTNADMARELDMAASAVFERVRKLEARGVITGYEARVAHKAVGLKLTAFVFVRAEERPFTGKTGQALAAIPNVQEVHNLAGEDCYLVKLRVRDTDDLTRVLREHFSAIPSITGTRTTIVLETVKETGALRLPTPEEAEQLEVDG
jgi:Lrp/AsnC family leucine-responsive transcriptional regulator